MGNIIGQSVRPAIGQQIKYRQMIQGAGYNDSSISRSPQVLNFLNNRNAWIKLASGTKVLDKGRLQDI